MKTFILTDLAAKSISSQNYVKFIYTFPISIQFFFTEISTSEQGMNSDACHIGTGQNS
jgi:hypothetical protein